MSEARYTLGLDFGTESARALLVNVATGDEVAECVFEYPHGVITDSVPVSGGAELGDDWALQHPQDYLDALERVVPGALESAGVSGEDVIGIGVDFTASTVMPTLADGTPLCFLDEHRDSPHAWVKLWKHHGAAAEAEQVIGLARERNEEFLAYYGGAVSSEWLLPKALETLHHAPTVYEAAAKVIEAGDWLVWQLTGCESRNSTAVGYKGLWVDILGYPSQEFLQALDPGIADLFTQKACGAIRAPGDRVGGVTQAMAEKLGLKPGTPVSAATIDAHAGVPGSGVTVPSKMVIIMGTSFCHLMLGEEAVLFEGFAGLVKDGITKGYYGYESGQTAGGDIYAWFAENCVPKSYADEAEGRGLHILDLLTERAAALAPGESGLVALDWWNGNRSILMDANLSGLIVGATLGTKPEEMFRAILEATAFGTRRIIQSYDDAGVAIEGLYACGGLPPKNPFLMQMFADITKRPIDVAASSQTVALGSTMFGALAAGKAGGGYDDITEAAERMVKPSAVRYEPNEADFRAYDGLYEEYVRLHDIFGKAEPTMQNLRRIRAEATE